MKTGDRAEQIAAGYLQRKGLALIETHYRCRWGEIDLIVFDGIGGPPRHRKTQSGKV